MKKPKPEHPRVQRSFKGVKSCVQASDMPLTSVRNLLRMGTQIPSPEDVGAVYGDFSSATDYQTMMDTIVNAQQAFDDLPSRLRDRFENDPANLIEFVNDDENYDEAVELGLIDEKTAFERQTQIDETPSNLEPAPEEKSAEAAPKKTS